MYEFEDITRVIQGIQICIDSATCEACPYKAYSQCEKRLYREAHFLMIELKALRSEYIDDRKKRAQQSHGGENHGE